MAEERVSALQPVPRHVAIIMDGNGRWAEARHLPRVAGHREGIKRIKAIISTSLRLGIRYLTLFAFSTENWERPRSEVNSLMVLLQHYLTTEVQSLANQGVRVRIIGNRMRLAPAVAQAAVNAESHSQLGNRLDLLLCISYSGRDDLVHAIREIATRVQRNELAPQSIVSALVTEHLIAADVPDPDLLIRTGGEQRLSNFLLWQIAYTELVFPSCFWPSFLESEYLECLALYAARQRRFGKLGS